MNNDQYKKLNLDFYPESLFKEVERVLGEEFIRLPKRIQTGYVNTFWNYGGVTRANQHNKDPKSFAMSNNEVNRNFTDVRNFRAVNSNGYYLLPRQNRYGLVDKQYVLKRKFLEGSTRYEPTNWLIKTQDAYKGWKEAGVVGSYNGYRLSATVVELLDDWNNKIQEDSEEKTGFTNLKNLEEQLGGAIHRSKSNRQNKDNVNLQVAINKDSLREHKRHLKALKGELERGELKEVAAKDNHKDTVKADSRARKKLRAEATTDTKSSLGGVNRDLPMQSLLSKDLTMDGISQRLVEINKLLAMAREGKGSTVPVIYTEVDTGRYTTKGAILQGYHKSVRYAALSGYYEYDLEAAHQNILIQLLDEKNESFPELDDLREYVANKQDTRVRLAAELDISVAVVKEIIQELTYGAQLSKSPRKAVHKSCDGDENLLEKVVGNAWLKDLESVFKLAHEHLIEDRDNIVNAVGIAFSKEKKGKSSEMAHILQGYERLVLDAVIKRSKREDIALLVHDCVVFYSKQSTDELSRFVKEETGMHLEFSEVRY